MKKLKITIALIVAAMMVFAFAACVTPDDNTPGPTGHAYPTELPDYEQYVDELRLAIAAFNSPPPTEEHYGWLTEAGFDTLFLDRWFWQKPGEQSMENSVQLAGEHGVRAFIMLDRDAGTDVEADFANNDYTGMPGFAGFYTDEPLNMADMDRTAGFMAQASAKYPDSEYITTLTAGDSTSFPTWAEAIDAYFGHPAGAAKYLSWDNYALVGTEYQPAIGKDWLRGAELFADAAKKHDKELWSFIASMSISSQKTRRPSEADLRYQSYVMLAYGSTGIEYFCYASPGYPPFPGEFKAPDWALIVPDGYVGREDPENWIRTDTWYSAKTVNEELLAFDHVYLSFDWQGVLVTPGTDAKTTAGTNCFPNTKLSLKYYPRVKKIEASEDTITGCFKDKDGYDGFMLVNFSDPTQKQTDNVKVTFNNASRAVVYANGVKSIVDLTNGVYETALAPGAGQFIIPIASAV
jgi:hypothetical protein